MKQSGYKKGCPKRRGSLTPEQQELAAEAFEHARCVAKSYGRKYPGMRIDWLGEISVRLCQLIGDFDASRSKLRTWAIRQAQFACRDAIRAIAPITRYGYRKPRFTSLDAGRKSASPATDLGNTTSLAQLIPAPPEPHPDEQPDALRILRGLTKIQRDCVWKSFVEEKPFREIAAEHGVSECRISQIRTEAIQILRQQMTA